MNGSEKAKNKKRYNILIRYVLKAKLRNEM